MAVTKPRQTAAQVAENFTKLLLDEKPNFVLWQTGTYDAMRGVGAESFQTTLETAVRQTAGRRRGRHFHEHAIQPAHRIADRGSTPMPRIRRVARESGSICSIGCASCDIGVTAPFRSSRPDQGFRDRRRCRTHRPPARILDHRRRLLETVEDGATMKGPHFLCGRQSLSPRRVAVSGAAIPRCRRACLRRAI